MAEASEAGIRATALPSSSDIYAELLELRGHLGISMTKIRDHCPNLMRLPATHDELARRGLNETELHGAAYYMLRCAIDEYIKHIDKHAVIMHELNYLQISGDLTKRRGDVSRALNISAKQVTNLSKDVFMHLSSVLVTLEESPCSEDRQSAIKAGTRIEISIVAEEGSEGDLLFRLIGLERRPAVIEALSAEAALRYPRAMSYWVTLKKDEDSDQFLRYLLSRAAMELYWRDSPLKKLGIRLPSALLSPLGFHLTFAHILQEHHVLPIGLMRFAILDTERLFRGDLTIGPELQGISAIECMEASTVSAIANVLDRIEDLDDWKRLEKKTRNKSGAGWWWHYINSGSQYGDWGFPRPVIKVLLLTGRISKSALRLVSAAWARTIGRLTSRFKSVRKADNSREEDEVDKHLAGRESGDRKY